MRRFPALLCGSLLVLAGCSGDPAPQPTTAPPCPTSVALDGSTAGFPEAQGEGEGATLWALFFSRRAIVDEELKIAWRMTGAGDLTMTATGPDGKTVKPTWGPEQHPASSFNRPGEEWGTGWTFPDPGCWTINATRDAGAGRLTLQVDPK